MPQVRCHVHRSPGSKLRPLCFSLTCPPSTLLLSLSISFHTNMLSCDFVYVSFPLQSLFGTVLLLLLWGLTHLVLYVSLLVITEQSRMYRFEQQLFMKAIQYSQCEYVRQPGNAHLIISELRFQVGERKRSHCAKITRSGQQRGVDNDAVVSEMTEVCSPLTVCVPHSGRSTPAVYLNEPFQNLKDE